ncbi:UNVERIFIED_CONTAM: hypothetical protein GTU68_025945 [Idotea baltica]|nr:hypothetical protein [Idotea baltica]
MKTFDVYPLFPLNIVSGKGAYVFDDKGNEYLDFYGGHAVISIGHSHPTYIRTIKEQVEKLGFYSNSVENRLQEELALQLGASSGYPDYSLFLVNSGAEANENALKLASFHTGKSKVLAFKNGFHGRTSAAVNVTDNEGIIAPINRGFERQLLEMDDIEQVENALESNDVAAIIIEGIQGIAGIYQPSADFLGGLKRLSKQYGAVLILDEIQSGYARSGHFFAHQFVNDLRPDLITMAKGMGNGFPIGGMLVAPHFESRYGLLGTTFGGNHLACAAANAVLQVMREEELIENAARMGQTLIKELKGLDGVLEVRGQGLILGLEFDYPVKDLRKKLLFEKKLFVGSASQPNTIRLLPPLNITEQEVDFCINRIKEAL